MTYVALDVHQSCSTYAYLDPSEQTVVTGRIHTCREELSHLLSDIPQPWTVALEATRCSPAVCAWLRDLDSEIRLVDPQKLSALADLRAAKTDLKDAELMLDALLHDYLPEAYLASEEVQMQRELLRAHQALVRISTLLRNLLRAMLARHGHTVKAKDLCGKAGLEQLTECLNDIDGPCSILGTLFCTLLQQVLLGVQSVDALIREQARDNDLAQELTRDPGKGPITVMGMLSELGDVTRFDSYKNMLSYAGLVPRVRQSGDRATTGRLPRRCNKRLRYWAVVAAQCAALSRAPSRAKSAYLRVKRKHGANTAKIAAAREILKDVYFASMRMQQAGQLAA